MEKTIMVGGKPVKLKTNAGLLRRYRQWFGRDIVTDMNKIMTALVDSVTEDDEVIFSTLPVEVLTTFEDLCYTMNKYGDPENVPDDIDEWLDSFETFDIYTVFPAILELWNEDNKTQSTAKKNTGKPQEN